MVLLATVAAYWPALATRAQYFDDDEYLNNNPLVQRPSAESALRFLNEMTRPSTVRGYYQPLTMISLMVDHARGGRMADPRAFRETSLALHCLNAALVVLLLYRLFGSVWPAAFVGLLFGLHPTAVESVAWLAERKNLLAMFFSLLSLLSYVEYARRGRRWRYVACVVAFALALLAKPTAVGLPVVMLLLDYWPLGRPRRPWKSMREKAHLFVIAVISAGVTCISQLSTVGTGFLEREAPLNVPLAVAHNNVFYLWKAFWPTGLCPFYAIPSPMDFSRPMMLVGVVGCGLLTGALLLSWRWTRGLVVGWATFFVLVFPTLGLVGFTPVLAADRFIYLPMLGYMLPLAAGLAWLWQQWGRARGRAIHRGAVVVAVLAAGLALSHSTRRYLADWRDTVTLQRAILDREPRCRQAHHNLGVELLQRGDIDGAIEHFEKALELQPEFGAAQYGLATALARRGRLTEALDASRRAVELSPHRPETRCQLATVLTRLGKAAEAETVLRECVRLFPNCATACNNLGVVLSEQAGASGREEAGRFLRQAVTLDPTNAAFECNLADWLVARGLCEEARSHYQRALALEPDHGPARAGLARARQGTGQRSRSP